MTEATFSGPRLDRRPGRLHNVPQLALDRTPRQTWARTYVVRLLVIDSAVTTLAWTIAWWALPRQGQNMALWAFGCSAMGALWLAANHNVGAYEVRTISTGTHEYLRIVRAASYLAGGFAFLAVVIGTIDGRRVVLVAIPIGTVLMLAGRYANRVDVHRRRLRGHWTSSILAVGSTDHVQHLIQSVNRVPVAGLVVVGACVEDARVGTEIAPGVPVVGNVGDAALLAADVNADVVAVAGANMGPDAIAELGWSLKGTGRSVVMAPALTRLAGPRISISPVEGLPLVWVDEPRFSAIGLMCKRALDVAMASAMVLLLAPVLLAIAALIRFTSEGPVIFRQRRLGKDGQWVTVLKFRTMFADAEERLKDLLHMNESSSVLFFKVKDDPRITRIGQFLRKYSLDELPQLFNVLAGTMSMVGPRPLPGEVDLYEGDFKRRMLVKPGLTGLWQVSGRSDLAVEDAVRLDLYYVENWSLALDIAIILRTVRVVLRRQGAY